MGEKKPNENAKSGVQKSGEKAKEKLHNAFLFLIRTLEVLILIGLASAILRHSERGEITGDEFVLILVFGFLVTFAALAEIGSVLSQIWIWLELWIRIEKYPNQVFVFLLFLVLALGAIYLIGYYVVANMSTIIAQFFLDECNGIGFEAPLGSYSLDVCLESRN